MRKRSAGFLVVVVVFGVLGWLIYSSTTFQGCLSDLQGQLRSLAPLSLDHVRAIAGTHVGCAADFTRKNHDIIVALAAVLLVLFAFILWRTMRRTRQVTDRHARLALRAYVGVSSVALDTPNLKKAAYEVPDAADIPAGFVHTDFLTVSVKNSGKTPARRVLAIANWAAMPFERQFSYTFEFHDQHTPEEIANAGRPIVDPEGTHTVRVRLSKLKPFRDAAAKTATIYVYGHVDYSDIFDQRWRRNFCYIFEGWRPVGDRLRPYFQHNDEFIIDKNDSGVLAS